MPLYPSTAWRISDAVTGRRSAMRNEISESWRMSFSVSLAMRRNCSWEGLEARHGCAPSRRILRTLAASLGWLMAADDIERLRRIYDAFDRRAVDDLLADLAHDMEWRAPDTLPWGGRRHGPEGVRTMVECLDEHVDGGWGDPDDYPHAGDRVGVPRRPRGPAPATRAPFAAPFPHLSTPRDRPPGGP